MKEEGERSEQCLLRRNGGKRKNLRSGLNWKTWRVLSESITMM